MMQAENTIWIQEKAPAGNWVDYTGFNYCADIGRTREAAIEQAAHHARYLSDCGRTTRIVQKYFAVID